MTTDPTTVASAFYAALEKAWNDADGAAFAAPFVADDVILAWGRSTLEVPVGPLAGVIHAVNSIVLVRSDDAEWRAASFHNTRVTG